MGLFNIEKPLDAWAQFDDAVIVTLIMQALCLVISLTLFVIRVIQVVAPATKKKEEAQVKLLQVSHLAAMGLATLYIFFHFWNYLHYFAPTNPLACDAWFVLVMCSLNLSKNFMYFFLMLRSSIAFQVQFFQIPLRVSVAVIILSIIAQWVPGAMMIGDFVPISPFPDNGFCFRILGESGANGLLFYNFAEAVAAVIALAVFWRKACFVRGGFAALQSMNEKESADMRTLGSVFNKHILLGILLMVGPIVLFFLSETLTVLMGIAGAVHLTFNNVYIFLFFKENIRLYDALCCCCKTQHEPVAVKQNSNMPTLELSGDPQPSYTISTDGSTNNHQQIVMASPNTSVLAVVS